MPAARSVTADLGRGINFGGAFDADAGHGGWLRAEHFDVVREAGFDTVRLPVKWPTHLGECPPHGVDATFFARTGRRSCAPRPSGSA